MVKNRGNLKGEQAWVESNTPWIDQGGRFGVARITPDFAREALDRVPENHNFRPLKRRRVDAYARDMVSGVWELNGASVTFGEDGFLNNGQHRLAACVKSGVAFETTVFIGAPAVSVDTGAGRTITDTLRTEGRKNRSSVACACRHLYYWERGHSFSSTHLTPTLVELLEVSRRWDEEMTNAWPYVTRDLQAAGFPPGPMLWFCTVALMEDRNDFALFMKQLQTGEQFRGARREGAIAHKFALASRMSGKWGDDKLSTSQIIGLVVDAWIHLKGPRMPIRALRKVILPRAPRDLKPEEFPRMIDPSPKQRRS